jgi:SAM-dependent methyltransferase
MVINIIKWVVHTITGTRKFYYKKLSEVALSWEDKDILEVGSGISINGEYIYSAKHLFHPSNNFECTDINPSFGHKFMDITAMDEHKTYDVILCLNVLEHVFETEKALDNLYRALRRDGVLYIAVPVHFPLHDEPHDYWRFTEHSLRRLLHKFSEIKIYNKGLRKFPFGYFVEARK